MFAAVLPFAFRVGRRWLPTLLLLGLLLPGAMRAQEPIISAAPLLEVDTDPGLYFWRFLGPIGEISHKPDGRSLVAVRPVFSEYKYPPADYRARDILWPLFTSRWIRGEYSRRGAVSEGITKNWRDPDSSWHFFFYPFYFKGKDENGENYFGIFPFAGHLRHAFAYEEVHFYAFPFYLSLDRLHTHSLHLLFPIYAKVQGPHVYKHRVWPFYGVVQRYNKWEQHFVLWPFINYGHSLTPGKPGSAFFLFPLYGRMSVRDATHHNSIVVENRTLLWPFLSGMRTKDGMRLYMPWPFFQWSVGMDGPGSSSLWFWPLYGQSYKQGESRHFWLWPCFLNVAEEKSKVHGERFYALPFYWQNIQTIKGEPYDTYRRVWPLFSYHVSPEKRTAIRVLDLWPSRSSMPINRNFSPFWTLYQYHASTTSSRSDFLWGFWEHEQRHGRQMKERLFPVYNFTRSAVSGSRTWVFFTGLVGKTKHLDGSSHLKVLWFIRIPLRGPRVMPPPPPPKVTPVTAGDLPPEMLGPPTPTPYESWGSGVYPTLSPLVPPSGL